MESLPKIWLMSCWQISKASDSSQVSVTFLKAKKPIKIDGFFNERWRDKFRTFDWRSIYVKCPAAWSDLEGQLQRDVGLLKN